MKKIWTSALLVAMTAALLAGCGAAKNNSGDQGNASQSASSESPSASKGAAPEKKDVTLKIMIPQPRFKEIYDDFFAKFAKYEKEQKNINVAIQLELPASNNASQILKTRLASNDAPDVYALHAGVELPDYYAAGYVEDVTDQPFVGKLLDSVKPSVTIDGKVLGVPMETLAWGYLYNKKIFRDLQLTPPKTITEMKQVAEKLKANKIDPFLLSYKESWIPQLFLPLTAGALINTKAPDFVEKMNKDEGSFAEIKDMFNIIDLVNSYGTDKALEVGGDDGAAAFANGKGAMWVQGPWFAESILKANPDFEIGVAALPVNDDPNATMVDLATSTTLVVSSASKNKDVAKDLLNYVLNDEVSSDLYQALKFSPVATVHKFPNYPWVDEATEYVKAGKAYLDPVIPQAVKDEIGKLMQTYYLKEISQDEVISTLDKVWKASNKAKK